MKINRGKWLLSLGLAAAVCISALGQGHGDHHQRHDGKGGKHHYEKGGKRNLSDRIYHITEADSLQKLKMKPSVDHASKSLQVLRLAYQKQEKSVLDSLGLQVKPYLKEDQLKKLNNWKDKTGK